MRRTSRFWNRAGGVVIVLIVVGLTVSKTTEKDAQYAVAQAGDPVTELPAPRLSGNIPTTLAPHPAGLTPEQARPWFDVFSWQSFIAVNWPALPGVPSQVLQVAPFPLMILTLLFVNLGNAEWVERSLARLPEPARRRVARLIRALRATPPSALGTPFTKE